jgi:hypothetical protein
MAAEVSKSSGFDLNRRGHVDIPHRFKYGAIDPDHSIDDIVQAPAASENTQQRYCHILGFVLYIGVYIGMILFLVAVDTLICHCSPGNYTHDHCICNNSIGDESTRQSYRIAQEQLP